MKTMKRVLAVLLACAMLIACTGCDLFASSTSGSDVSQTDVPVVPTKNEELAAIDMEMFESLVTSDIFSYNLSIAHPENFDFEKPKAWWGDFSYTEAESSIQKDVEWLERLNAIDRETLLEDEKITYDTLKQSLELSIESFDYYYYDEILTPYNGLQTYLALNLVFFDIDTLEDVEDYLLLVEDAPRFIGQVVEFEQEKSAAGLFMTDAMLDTIEEQITDFVDGRDTCFLFDTFEESIAEIDMTDAEREAFLERNIVAVNGLVDGYQTLYDGLEALRGTNVNTDGLCAYGKEGKDYFALTLKDAACDLVTPKQAMSILETEMDAQINRLVEAGSNDPTVWDSFDTIELSLGTTEENMAYLEKLFADYYPELQNHSITYMNCPEVLEDQFSPAAYLIPAVDDASENVIILNDKTMSDDTRYLDTLAHEGYPGHLYHYQYVRSIIEKTGYTRQSLNLTGYYEAWSQTGEWFFDTYNDEFSNDYCSFMSANTLVSGLLLCSMFSIGVNYEGWTTDDIYEYLAYYFGEETAEEYKQVFYDEAVQNPFYYIEYGLGLSIYSQKLREVQEKLGENFELLAFNQTYLDIGPTYFNISMPIIDEWVDERSAAIEALSSLGKAA